MYISQQACLENLQQQLDALRQGQCQLRDYLSGARQQDALLETLPPVFGEVWHNLLDRLESASLFAEESCSFSQKDLLESMQMWLDKATLRLKA
jgi:hypothetical protein